MKLSRRDFVRLAAGGAALSVPLGWNRSDAAMLGSRTKFVHVKNTKKEDGKVLMILPGDGAVDCPRLFRLLSHTGYSGPEVVEVSGMIFQQPGYNPIATAEKCHRHLRQALIDSGVPQVLCTVHGLTRFAHPPRQESWPYSQIKDTPMVRTA